MPVAARAEGTAAKTSLTAWRVDELPQLAAMRDTIANVLDANHIEYPGATGWVQTFWAGDAYHGIFARDIATIGPLARFFYTPSHLTSPVEEAMAYQIRTGPDIGALPGVYYPGGGHDKASATSDEDMSYVHLAYVAYSTSGRAWLQRQVDGATIVARLNAAMDYLFRTRQDPQTGLIKRANTTDWGDVKATGGTDPTDIVPGDIWTISIYDQSLAFRTLLELATMNEAVGDTARAADLRGRAAGIRDATNALMWQSARGYYRARLVLTDTPPTFDEGSIVSIGNVEAVRSGLADAEQARLIFRNLERARIAAKSPKVGLVAWPPYPESVFTSMMPGEYQNGGIWDWWGGRQIEGEFESGQAALGYQHLAALAADWATRPGEIWEWQELWSLVPRGSTRYSGAAGTVGAAIVGGLFGIEMNRDTFRLSPRLAGRSGAIIADQPGTDHRVQLELGGLANGLIAIRYNATYAAKGEMRYLLPPGQLLQSVAIDGLAVETSLLTVGDDTYAVFPLPGGAHGIELRVGTSAEQALSVQQPAAPSAGN